MTTYPDVYGVISKFEDNTRKRAHQQMKFQAVALPVPFPPASLKDWRRREITPTASLWQHTRWLSWTLFISTSTSKLFQLWMCFHSKAECDKCEGWNSTHICQETVLCVFKCICLTVLRHFTQQQSPGTSMILNIRCFPFPKTNDIHPFSLLLHRLRK